MTDIVGSTEHASELGDSAWRQLVQQHHELVRAALRRHGGREIDTAGDGFFATFDAPASAVACALEIASGVKELGIDLRAGVHVGEVEQIGRKVGGITVPIAARIMAEAAPGEVLVSSTVRDMAAGSRLTFDDRGVKALKGVPGEWHVYAVARAQPEVVDTGADLARERRASAVRRAGSRPIWRRRPRLVTFVALAVAAVLATGALLVIKPWQAAALAEVKENSIGIIDPGRTEVVDEFEVSARPGGIAVGEGYAWVTNTGANSVAQVDLARREVVFRIAVGRAPKGIAVAERLVWVANSGERTVSRINAATGAVVGAPIEVGNAPTAIAAAGPLLWVANATDSTVVSIDARTGAVGQPVGVGATPIALAVHGGGLWVLSEDGASVSHLDPASGATLAPPIQLNARPSALALDEDSVWVATVDGRVKRFDRATHGDTGTFVVGGRLAALAITSKSIWVGDQDGSVYRLDAADNYSRPKPIPTKTAVTSLTEVDGNIWLAAQPSALSHKGGVLQIVEVTEDGLLPRDATDPLSNSWNGLSLDADGLVGHRRVGGAAGSVLLPDLAMEIPRPTNGGLTYTFQLRPDLSYSTGEPVRASDFRRGMERSFQVDSGTAGNPAGAWGNLYFLGIVGSEPCGGGPGWRAVEICDLSAGVLTDDVANTVTINLSEPDPDFAYKLAQPPAYPVPEGVPMNALLDGAAFPGTGPYYLTGITDSELRLARNPHFRVREGVRPDGFPDEIVVTVVDNDERRVAMIENREADFTRYRASLRTSPDLFARFATQYAGQWHPGAISTGFVNMNSSIPPFNQLPARQAVNFAIDRGHMSELTGGPPDAAVTCQLLPPGWPGYQPYCPYTRDPDDGGRWKGPDMQAAQRLIDESGTFGQQVTVGPTFGFLAGELEYLGSVLEDLGYEVSIDSTDAADRDFEGWDPEVIQISINGWGPDYTAASAFAYMFTCDWADPVLAFCDQDFEAAYDHALALQATDPTAANAEWAALDRRAVDLALLAPTYNAGADFVSDRVGNFQFSPAYRALVDQMWVQ